MEIEAYNDANRIIIMTYGPNEDDKKEEKDKFWKTLQETIDDTIGKNI